MTNLEQFVERRQRTLQHLMSSLEGWRGSDAIVSKEQAQELAPEEAELAHAYDLLQKLIAEIQQAQPGHIVDVTA